MFRWNRLVSRTKLRLEPPVAPEPAEARRAFEAAEAAFVEATTRALDAGDAYFEAPYDSALAAAYREAMALERAAGRALATAHRVLAYASRA